MHLGFLTSVTMRTLAQTAVGMLLLGALVTAPLVVVVRAVRVKRPRRRLRVAAWICGILLLLALTEAFIEPHMLTVTRVSLPVRGVPAGTRLRVVHLSDLHFIGYTDLHRRLVARVAAERPDLIVITGDLFTRGGPKGARSEAARLLNQLAGMAPTVLIAGNHDVYHPPMRGGRWTLLEDEHRDLTRAGVPLRLIGWSHVRYYRWPPRCAADPRRVNLVLLHSPDWSIISAAHGMDLALAGHTHGGQIRLPLWGAIHANSHYGKRFAYGLHNVDGMPLFVTRGIGQMPWPAPPVRFCCPPEVVVLELTPSPRH